MELMEVTKVAPTPKTYSFLKMASILFAVVPLNMGLLNLQTLGKPDVYAHFHSQAERGNGRG